MYSEQMQSILHSVVRVCIDQHKQHQSKIFVIVHSWDLWMFELTPWGKNNNNSK